jgi:hypothetical protein
LIAISSFSKFLSSRRRFRAGALLKDPFLGALFLTLFNLQGTLVGTYSAPLYLPCGRYPLRSVVPPLQIEPASLGFDLMMRGFLFSRSSSGRDCRIPCRFRFVNPLQAANLWRFAAGLAFAGGL